MVTGKVIFSVKRVYVLPENLSASEYSTRIHVQDSRELSQAYRWALSHGGDELSENLGTLLDFPVGIGGSDQCSMRGGGTVVVRGRESLPHGEGFQLRSAVMNRISLRKA